MNTPNPTRRPTAGDVAAVAPAARSRGRQARQRETATSHAAQGRMITASSVVTNLVVRVAGLVPARLD